MGTPANGSCNLVAGVHGASPAGGSSAGRPRIGAADCGASPSDVFEPAAPSPQFLTGIWATKMARKSIPDWFGNGGTPAPVFGGAKFGSSKLVGNGDASATARFIECSSRSIEVE